MNEPLKLVPLPERDKAERASKMLRHLEYYRDKVERGEIDQLAIVATYADGDVATSSVEVVGQRLKLFGGVHVLALRLEADIVGLVKEEDIR